MKRISTASHPALAFLAGCHHGGGDDCNGGPWRFWPSGRGAISARPPTGRSRWARSPIRHWETQQTNAEAADFLFYDHEFRYDTKGRVDTAELTPGAKKHLMQVALRLEHVPSR